MNKFIFATVTILSAIAASAEATITDVTAQQRYPWNGKVDISYTASGVAAAASAKGMTPELKVMAIDRATSPWTTNTAESAHLFVGPLATEPLTDAVALADGAHRIVWDMDAQGLSCVSTNVIFTVSVGKKSQGGVQLWENGPYWAECNVGATDQCEFGHYYWWGGTTACRRNANNDGWETLDGTPIIISDVCPTVWKDIYELRRLGYVNILGNLMPAHDAATQSLGAPWRMPTRDELISFTNKCTFTKIMINNQYGILVTGKGAYASKKIFLPSAGYGFGSYMAYSNSVSAYLWSSTARTDRNLDAYCFIYNFERAYLSDPLRDNVMSVRPVRGFDSATPWTLCTGESEAVRIDLRTGMVRTPAVTETLTWSADWYGGDTVTLAVNGTELASGLSGSGTHDWTAEGVDVFTLTHTVVTSGVPVVLTAKFAVPGITGLTAQQRYPWNGKVDITYTASGVVTVASAKGMSSTLKVLAIDRTTTPWTTNVAEKACLFVGPRATEPLTDGVAFADGTHQIVWDMDAQGFSFVSTGVVFEVLAESKPLGGVQLWKNGPFWAECNVDATKPEEHGSYFWWGDTVGYKRNETDTGWISVKDGTPFEFKAENCPTYRKSPAQLKEEGYLDSAGNLAAAYDAATQHLGAPWRMPTAVDMSNLVEKCATTWITTNGVSGRLVRGVDEFASNSIFLPIHGRQSSTGYYFASSISTQWPENFSVTLSFTSYYFYPSRQSRISGYAVRPVREGAATVSFDPVTLCAAASEAVRVDLRTGQVRVPAETETLTWSADWDGGKSVTLATNGTKIATGLKGSGTYTWAPNGLRGYTLTHTVIAGGAYVVHSAEFFVPVPLVEVSPTPLEGTAFTVWTNGVAVATTDGKCIVETNETVTVVYAVSNDDYVWSGGPKSATFNASGAPGTPEAVRPEAPTRIWFTKTSANFDIGYTLDGHGNAQYVVTHPEQVTMPIAYSTNNWDSVEGASKVTVLSQRHTPEGPVVTNVAETVENGEQGWQPDEGDFGLYNFGACAMTLDLASTNWLDASVLYTTNFNLSVVQPTAGGSVSACTNGVAAGESSWPLALIDQVSVEATPANVLWVLDTITTNGAPMASSFVMPLDDVSVTAIFRYRGVDIPEAAPLAHTTRTLYTNDVESAALAVTVVSNTSAYVVYTADAGYYFADASTVQTNAVDTTTDPATFAALPPAPETSVPCTTWEQVKKMLEEGIPVKLMADIDPADETIVLTNSDVFIDLNGHEVRSTADPLFKVSDEATLTLTGDSGSLTGNVEVAEGGKFEMDGGTYEGEITVDEGGKFEMNGGTFEGELEADEDATVVVNGGVIGSDALDEYLAPGKERIDLGGGKSIIGQDVARDPDTGAITEGVFTFNPTNTEYAAIGVKLEDGLVAVYREDAAPTPGYVVGRPEDLAEHVHDDITWHPWTGSKALPTEEGAYYLVYDVVLQNEYAAADGVKLCLNGKTVKAAADRRVASVGAGVTFLMADCRGTGVLTGGVTDEPGAGVFVEGEFDFLGGSITGNVSSAGALATSNGTIVVGGTARVADNVGTNVYLFTGAKLSISGNSALREGADLRVLTEEKPQQMRPVAITMSGARTNLKFFHAEAAAEAVEYANGGLWLAVPTPILVTPTPVAHTTVSVYTNGVLSSEAGSGQWQAWSNQLATVVYTPADGYIFPDGTTAKTNLIDTAVDPATVQGELPPEGAFYITSQAALTSAIAALNAQTNYCSATWYIGADFTVTEKNAITKKYSQLTILGNGHVLTADSDEYKSSVFEFTQKTSKKQNLVFKDLSLVVTNSFGDGIVLNGYGYYKSATYINAVFDNVNVELAHAAAPQQEGEDAECVALVGKYSRLTLTNSCTIAADTFSRSAIDLVSTNNASAKIIIGGNDVTFVDKRAPETIAVEPLVKYTNEEGGSTSQSFISKAHLTKVSLKNGSGWSLTIPLTPPAVTHTTCKVYAGGQEITGKTTYNVPSNGAPVEVVYAPASGYTFPDGTTAKTNTVDTTKNPAMVSGDLPSAGAYLITDQTTLAKAISALKKQPDGCDETWYVNSDFTVTNKISIAGKAFDRLTILGNNHTITAASEAYEEYALVFGAKTSADDVKLDVRDLGLVVSNNFRSGIFFSGAKGPLVATLDNVDVTMSHSSAPTLEDLEYLGSPIVNNFAKLSLTNGCTITAGKWCWAALDVTSNVGTNAALNILSDDIRFVDNRMPAVIAVEPLITQCDGEGGTVTISGIEKTSLAWVELAKNHGYGFVVGLTPSGVDNATCKVYAFGKEIAGPAPYLVPSNAAPVEVVYTPVAGYVFTDGSAAKTNEVDTSVNPAKVTGDLPATPAVRIGSEEDLEAAAAAVNAGTVGPTVVWCVTDDFTVSKKTALKRKGLNLTIFGNGHTITAEQVGTLADYVFDFTAVYSLEMSVEIDSLNLVVGDGFRNGLQVQWDESAGNKYRPMNATLTDVNITMARTAAPKKGGEVKLGAALVDNDGLVTLKGACAFTADQWTYSAIDITAKSFCDGNFDATVTIDSAAEVTFVDGRANTIAAVEPLVKLTDENAGDRTAVAVGMERTALAEVSLANGDGWSYAVSLTLSDLDHATYKLYLGSEEIVGSSPYQLPSNAAPVTVVYTSADGYVFRHGAKVVTNAVDTTKNPATTPDVGSAKPIVVMIGDKGYASLEDAIAAANDGDKVTIVSDQSIDDLLVMKNITLDLNGNTLTNAACTVNEGATATVTNSVSGAGGLVNAGAVTVSGTLDMSSLTWGAGGFIPGPNGTLAIAKGGLVKMGSTDGKSPNWMLANKANFFNGSEDGARLTIGTKTYTKVGEFWSVDDAAATAEVETPGSLGQSGDLAYVESFDTLAAAVSSVKTNGTVTLVNDVAADEVGVAKDMTLDLDGWTLFAPTADAVALRLTAGSVVVTNGAVSNAVVKLDGTTGRFAIADTVTFVGTARVLMTDEFQAAVAVRTASVTGFEAAIDLGDGTACGMPTLQEAMDAADEDSTLRIVNDLALASLAVKTNCVLDCNSHTCRVDGVLSAASGAALALDANSTVRMGTAFEVQEGFTIGTAEDLLALGVVKVMEPADGVTFTDEELKAFAAKVVPYDPEHRGYTIVVIDGAIWIAARFLVSYDAQDGAWADGTTVSNIYSFISEGYRLPQENPSRANYEFAGWYSSWTNGARQVMSGEPLEVFTDHKVYAKWLSKSVDPEHGEEILSGKDTDGGAAVIVTGAATNEQGAVVGAVENGTLAIPERIGNGVDGKFVKTLGRKAYAAEKYDDKVADDKKLRSVLFPTFMTRIGDEAFQNASRITNLTFAVTRDYKTGEKTTFDIGSRAFENTAVSTVVFPAGSKTKLRANSFANCTNLSEICVFGEIVGLDRGPFSGCGQKGGEVVLRLSPAYASDTAFVAMLTADLNATRVKISTEPLGQVMMKKIEVDVVTGDVTVTFAADLTSPWSVVNEDSVSLFYTDDISKGFVGTGKVAYPNGPVTKDDSGDYKAVFTVPNPRSGQQFYRLTVGDERK